MMHSRLSEIKLLLLDADGVLTNGSITYTDDGNVTESKSFNVKDGFGLRLLKSSEVKIGIISGRLSEAVERRARELELDFCYCGISDKSSLLSRITGLAGCSLNETAFVGDDIPDLEIMEKVGLAVAVADAHQEVLRRADLVTENRGGYGAVREVCERILRSKGLWEDIIKSWASKGLPDSGK